MFWADDWNYFVCVLAFLFCFDQHPQTDCGDLYGAIDQKQMTAMRLELLTKMEAIIMELVSYSILASAFDYLRSFFLLFSFASLLWNGKIARCSLPRPASHPRTIERLTPITLHDIVLHQRSPLTDSLCTNE